MGVTPRIPNIPEMQRWCEVNLRHKEQRLRNAEEKLKTNAAWREAVIRLEADVRMLKSMQRKLNGFHNDPPDLICER